MNIDQIALAVSLITLAIVSWFSWYDLRRRDAQEQREKGNLR